MPIANSIEFLFFALLYIVAPFCAHNWSHSPKPFSSCLCTGFLLQAASSPPSASFGYCALHSLSFSYFTNLLFVFPFSQALAAAVFAFVSQLLSELCLLARFRFPSIFSNLQSFSFWPDILHIIFLSLFAHSSIFAAYEKTGQYSTRRSFPAISRLLFFRGAFATLAVSSTLLGHTCQKGFYCSCLTRNSDLSFDSTLLSSSVFYFRLLC